MIRLFLFIFILFQTSLCRAESYSLKCDANDNVGTLTFRDHEQKLITLAVGGGAKTFDPAKFKSGIYKTTFSPAKDSKRSVFKRNTDATIYIIIQNQLPTGFILIRDGGPSTVIIDFLKSNRDVTFKYSDFGRNRDRAPPNNHVLNEYVFTSSDFHCEFFKKIDGVESSLFNISVKRTSKDFDVKVAALRHVYVVGSSALNTSFVRPPSAEPLNDDDDDDNARLPDYAELEASGLIEPAALKMDLLQIDGDDNNDDDDYLAERRVVLYVPPVVPNPPVVHPEQESGARSSSSSSSFFTSIYTYTVALIGAADEMVESWLQSDSNDNDDVRDDPRNGDQHVIFGHGGWGVSDAAPFSLRYNQDLLSLSFSAESHQAATFDIPINANHVTFNACLNGQDENSTAQVFIKEVESDQVIEALCDNVQKMSHIIAQQDNYKKHTIWFQQEDGKNYKLYFSANPETVEAVNLSIRDFAVE